MSNIIKVIKGVLYFPTMEAAKGFADHCGLTGTPRFHTAKGWTVQGNNTK